MKLLDNNAQFENWNQFILDGDLEALSKVYYFYYDFLFDYGLRLTSDRQAVEDAIQNEFVNFIKSQKGIGCVKNLSGYLICAFRRQLIADLKKQKRTFLSEVSKDESSFDYFRGLDQGGIAEKENLEQVFLAVKQSIGKLTERQQEIIFLRFEKDISYEEISEMLNISVHSCYKLVYRSIKSIRIDVEKMLGKGTDLIFWFLVKPTK